MNETTTNMAAQSAQAEGAAQARRFRPKFALYKANGKGTGCAIKFELHPAHDTTDGSIFVTMANQLTVGDRSGPNPTYARFDWENAVFIKLDFNDLTKMLQVFRGECESIEDGKGLYHRSPRATTRILLRHNVEPSQCYTMEAFRTMNVNGAQQDTRTHFLFSPHEALGLAAAIEDSLGVICFGVPMVIEHDTTAYRQGVKEMRNVRVA